MLFEGVLDVTIVTGRRYWMGQRVADGSRPQTKDLQDVSIWNLGSCAALGYAAKNRLNQGHSKKTTVLRLFSC